MPQAPMETRNANGNQMFINDVGLAQLAVRSFIELEKENVELEKENVELEKEKDELLQEKAGLEEKQKERKQQGFPALPGASRGSRERAAKPSQGRNDEAGGQAVAAGKGKLGKAALLRATAAVSRPRA